MAAESTTPLTPEQARWYVAGPLDPAALGNAVRAVYAVLRTSRSGDVWSALYDGDRAAGTRLTMPELGQIARATLAAIVGIGALEVRDPVRALQLWQSKNEDATLLWAFGEVLAKVSDADWKTVEGDRAAGRGVTVKVPTREDAA